MIVQRLTAWFSRIAASIARAWRAHATRTTAPAPTVQLVRAGGGASGLRSGFASSHWLDDAHRLRARERARVQPALPPASREQLRRILSDPRWAVTYDAALAPRPPRAPQPGDVRAPQQTSESSTSRPLAASGSAAASADQLDRDQRRLTFVRNLVRRGVYNEGFDPLHLPDQYRPKGPDDSD